MTDPKPETCPDCRRRRTVKYDEWVANERELCFAHCLGDVERRQCAELANQILRSELATAQAELATASKVIDAAFRWQNACGDNELIAEYQLIDELQRYEAALPKAPGESLPEPPLQKGGE